jgi:O-antigen/teichoic acid export membrane protein
MAAGFALVLALVRLLPADIYGGLVLTKVLLLVVVSLAGLGLSQAAVRWSGVNERPERILGTTLGGVALTAVPAAALLIFLMTLLADRLKMALGLPLMMATFVLVLSYMLNNELLNWPRAQHQPKRHAVLNTLRAIQQMVSIIAGVLLTQRSTGYIYGLAGGEMLFLVWLMSGHRGGLAFQTPLLGEMLRYGWPHTLVIASGFLLNYGDRYMLAFLTSDNALVAYYDAASMVVTSALALLVRPFNLFLFPAYTRRYEEAGHDATVAWVNRAQRLFLIAGLGISTLVVILRVPLLQLLFPAGYSSAASIFAPVAYGTVLNGVFMATVAGLYLSKKTVMVGVAAVVAVVANLLANWLLIPRYGINGAAFGMALASLVQLLFGYGFSRLILPVKLPLGLIVGGALWLAFIDAMVS